ERDAPREEAWLEDVTTARESGRDPAQVYRHLRAAAESGWDFSTRWLAEDRPRDARDSLVSICTTDIVPVDLNAFLYKLETTISAMAEQAGDSSASREF